MFSRSQIVSCAATLVLTGAGWAQMQQPGQMQPPGGPPAGVPQSTVPATAGSSTQTQAADPYSTDKDFVRSVAEASATEVHLGRIAQDKASTDAVKEFGKQMAEANTQTTEQLKQAAAALKIDVPAAPPRKAKKDEEKLAKLSGADFDRTYTKMAADEQKQTVKEFAREAKSGKAENLKEYAAKNLPSEQDRQKQADELAASGTTTNAKGSTVK
jgi:putative membrane protein